VGPPDKLLFVASLAFDLSVYDIFGILASGASLRVTAAEDIKDPRKLLDIIMTEGITFWDSAPAALQQVVPFLHEVKDYSTRGRMRLVFLSGDWIPVAMPDELRKAFTGVRVISLGGATEATIWSNYYPIDGVNPSWPSIPYGKPIQNAKYYILDRSLEICPIRIPGDLYIGGECLASGYINEVELTAEKFILAHSSWLMADRVVKQVTDQYPMSYQLSTMNYIYKTGDIARWFDDGNIQFLGRKDHQVKIRGFRVELGEIEAQLLNHQLISDGVVVDRQDASGSKYLCAYYILKDPDAGIDKAGLKEHMAGELPEYMIPAYFIPIDKIPLTANGKLDRKGLPQPEGTIMVKRHYAVPVNKIQKTLVQIWSQLLFGRNSASLETPIGIDDDFFELGGHSLNATIAASRIHKELNVKIPLAEIFNSPTIRELSGKINQLSEERFSPIEPVEKKEYYVLSSAQRRLYFLQQMESENISYNIQEAVLMEGEIDIRRLEKTFLELIQRHETLRTSFEMVSGDIVQRIHGEAAFENELCVTPEAIMPAFVRPFDLSRAPLLRVGLIRPTFPPSALRSSPSPAHEGENSTNKYILMVDMHHIISDGVSHALLIRDFTTLYSGKPLSPIRIHYKDYSLWQTGEKQKQIIKRQEAYWLKEFEADVPVLDLPIDYPRPMIQNFQGRSLQFEIGPRETAALKQLAAEQKATLFMVLLAVYNVLLAKICNQEDIVVGTPIAGRNHADLDKIIGMFVNTLVLRNHPTGEKSFIGFLHEAKDKCLRAFENQDYLFEDLVEKAAVHRDTSRNPLFDVMLVLQNLVIDTNNTPSQLSGMELKPYDYAANISQFDLTLNASEMADKILVKVEYCTKLFQEKTMLRIICYLKKVVTSVITGSWKSLSEINLLSDEEKKQVLFDFNDTDTSYPAHKTTHELFAEQVKRVPHHIALLGKEKEGKDKRLRGKKQRESFGGNILLTYKELNEKASQLAFRLQEKGAQPDAIVAIMAGRSLEMIIGILAILKSGGAYLPIDPEYPQDRIDYMLNDSNAGILVTTSIQQVKVKVKVINLTSPSEPPEATPSTLTCQVSPANLAYIIYTSGTTGKPKGTLIEHGNVVRLMFNDKFQFDFSKTDVWTLFHSFCFDFSVWEMYGALLYGAKLVVIPKIVARDPEKYLKQLKEQCVTVLNQTPSAFYHLIDEELKCPDKYLNLKYVIFGGEALNPAKLSEWYAAYPDTKLINMFGITETTVHVTFKQLKQREILSGMSNIGKPIPTLKTYIIDRNLKLLPIGVPGECCVGGDGVARGYLNRPLLTKEKFIENPYIPGERWYKSGDLIRLLTSGDMEYLGRIDHQVKIRGFRIELGEIENQLLNHEGIKRAVVLLKGDRLFAYITAEKSFNASQLREYLSRRLPDYMIPSYFMQLGKIPLTSNGKVDHKALDSYGKRLTLDIPYSEPRNEIEKKIVGVWKEVLSLDKIGIHDNYFELGGTSFDIIRINKRLKDLFQIEVPVVTMFRYTTVHSFANNYLYKKTNEIRDREAVFKRGKRDKMERLQRRRGT
jgi:amino acid adenylation domain-containing protein